MNYANLQNSYCIIRVPEGESERLSKKAEE
jgi:hypothetical protein